MENPEVKWKQSLFIPGGSRVEAKSCSCQRPVCSWAFVLLPFYPPITFLPGPKATPTWWVVLLEITEDVLWALSHHFELHCLLWSLGWEGTPVGRQITSLIVQQQGAAITSLLLQSRAFGNCTYLCSESLSWQLLGFHDYLSEVFKSDSDAAISSQDWLQTVFPIGNRLALQKLALSDVYSLASYSPYVGSTSYLPI